MSLERQNGNVLFLILIAVALFAALSYAVTQSTRSGSGNTDKEKSELDVNTMMQYGVDLRTAVTRLLAGGNCTDETISFESPNWTNAGDYVNASAPPNKSCHMFDPAGGGVSWQKPPKSSQDVGGTEYAISGNMGVFNVGLDDCDHTDMMMFVPVSKAMCISINTRLGITNPSGNPPAAATLPFLGPPPAGYMAIGWDGGGGSHYRCGYHLGYDSNSAQEVRGKLEGCFTDADRGLYYFYEVLLAR